MRICKKTALSAVLVVSSSLLFAQLKMPEMPSMTNISDGPSMPRISAPVLGSTFYVPGNIYNRRKSEVIITNPQGSDAVEAKADSVSAGSEAVAAVLRSGMHLTASDVSDLGDNGLFGGIYGLLGDGSASSVSKVLATSSSQDVMLQQILKELETLKTQNENLQTKFAKEGQSGVQAVANGKPEKGDARILRFFVNGSNLLDTCRTVYFSKKEQDGSFLLTGDRKYSADNKSRDETFYLLFKADGNCGTTAGYDVEPKVIQDYKNEYSYLYQLSKKHNLKAEKTGNLVALRCQEPAWNMDLLIDIGSN